jgi:hypothetical protein
MTDEHQQAGDDQAEPALEDLDAEALPPREVMSVVELGDGFSTNPIYTLPVEPPDSV